MQSRTDSSYPTITNPWLIESDWKLCIPDAASANAGITIDKLMNMGVPVRVDPIRPMAPLTNGEYSESVAPGSATKTSVKLTDHTAFGYIDGKPAAAVILVTDPGGSGTFYYLALVTESEGKLTNIATTLLGDRVQINSLAVKEGKMILDMITQGPDDPFCCPTQRGRAGICPGGRRNCADFQ